MLIRIGNHFIETSDLCHVVFSGEGDELLAEVSVQCGNTPLELKFSGGEAAYLQSILDAQHFISIQHLRDNLPKES